MLFDPARLRENIRQATTADLLDRATIDREGLEPEARDLIDRELATRGITAEERHRHAQELEAKVLRTRRGQIRRCLLCGRPAVGWELGWVRLFGLVPVWRRRRPVCEAHRHAGPDELTSS